MQSEIQSLVNQKTPSLFPPFFSKLFSSISAQAAAQPPSTTGTTEIPASIAEFLTVATAESLGLVTTRQLLTEFVGLLAGYSKDYIKSNDNQEAEQVFTNWQDIVIVIWRRVIHVLSDRGVAFEELISQARECLASLLELQEKWSEAAAVLKGIPLDSGTRAVPDDYKVKIYIQIVRYYLEDEDSVSADAYLNRAAMLNPQDPSLQVHLQASQARSLDFKRQFVLAALKYLDLSYNTLLEEAERIGTLIAAVTCAILAGAGPQRSRLLATLYKDERVRERPELKKDGVAAILEKMYLGTIVKREHVTEFASKLLPHQLAVLSDGVTTVLDKAVMEHNLLASSRLYLNIKFEELGLILGVDADRAEVMARSMIEEGRMQGKIDQIDKLVYFSDQASLNGEWDNSILGLCQQLDSIAEKIKVAYPSWTPPPASASPI